MWLPVYLLLETRMPVFQQGMQIKLPQLLRLLQQRPLAFKLM